STGRIFFSKNSTAASSARATANAPAATLRAKPVRMLRIGLFLIKPVLGGNVPPDVLPRAAGPPRDRVASLLNETRGLKEMLESSDDSATMHHHDPVDDGSRSQTSWFRSRLGRGSRRGPPN